jgi:hypothetical protein
LQPLYRKVIVELNTASTNGANALDIGSYKSGINAAIWEPIVRKHLDQL